MTNTKMISQYPEFTKLSLDLEEQINQLTAKYEPYSDFNFISMFAWDTDGSTSVSELNDNLVIRMPDYLDGSITYSLLGTNRIDESLATVLEQTGSLQLIPEVTVAAIQNPTMFHVLEDRDSFDYIYDLDHLTKMSGAKFKHKRNKNNVFVKDHENLELVVNSLTQLDAEQIDRLKNIDRLWTEQTPEAKAEEDIIPERKAIARILENFNNLELVITQIIVNGEVKAFSINELIDSQYTICHFEKALTIHHEHINTFLVAQVAEMLESTGRRFMNWEQDLGLPGLRKSKMSYHPVKMLKKYSVELKP